MKMIKNRWPITIDELIIEANEYFNDFKTSISNTPTEKIDNNIIIRALNTIIRLNHVIQLNKISVSRDTGKILLEQLIDIIKQYNLIPKIKELLSNSINFYKDWIEKLPFLIEYEEMEPYHDILFLRDDIQGEMEILSVFKENIIKYQFEIELIDEKFKEIGCSFETGVLDETNSHLYPRDIYWWWYFGGTKVSK